MHDGPNCHGPEIEWFHRLLNAKDCLSKARNGFHKCLLRPHAASAKPAIRGESTSIFAGSARSFRMALFLFAQLLTKELLGLFQLTLLFGRQVLTGSV
jgi:hypothetical protein